MESEFDSKMEELRAQFNIEKEKKAALDLELKREKEELENIETRFPMEVSELKEQIDFAKQQTLEYEKKTKGLQEELNALRA